ncbi:periplasmic nitrate reductase, NapE protein [Salipiger mangrovisoli]|uniref:Nitrate reductase n=1 Tax=Salipiger mangrovisoli TaxID=2865933 RepID=A0ABR9X4D0_9RHOB|nr:nitrate reductase [Salipiger mangrovisoli]MBE9638291.1 nitrate reductase [Salipiger mangrovisoli]
MIDSVRPQDPPKRERSFKEWFYFLLLAFGVWPIAAIAVVGGYGFLVWMFQILTGPPGPPVH